MDVRSFNRNAWDRQVATGNRWTVPVGPEVIAAARQGKWEILLTPTIPVPHEWFHPLKGAKVLCLASGGGQQGPVLAAAGAEVTVFDNSPKQLAQDRMVAEREGLQIITVEGDMRDLSTFQDESFDLIFHPVSNVFIPNVRPVWREAFRVLRPGGALLAGFTNPLMYLFDFDLIDQQGILEIKYSIPYSDVESLSEEKKQKYQEEGWPLEFSHTLDDQIGGQLEAGFMLAGFYEDSDPTELLHKYIPTFIATRAIKPHSNNKVDNLVKATNEFAFSLFEYLQTIDPYRNITFSPYSIAAALAMTANGARGQTLDAFHQVLGLQGLSVKAINQAHAAVLKMLQAGDSQIQLAVANAIWGRLGLNFTPNFIQTCQNYFDAEIRELDFTSPDALSTINAWVEDKTEHKIKDLLNQKDLGPATLLVLINAIYFKGFWQTQFDPQHTHEGAFHLADGTEKLCQMMALRGESFPYLRSTGFQATSLPYGDGSLGFYAFLPDTNTSLIDFHTQLMAENWQKLFEQFKENQVDIVLPRFKLEYELELSEVLAHLGMGIAFSGEANFGDMSSGSAAISKVRHKAFLQIDEAGAEAAAATAVLMARGVMPKPRMVFNRPFFYAICDNQTGAILFIGSLYEPD